MQQVERENTNETFEFSPGCSLFRRYPHLLVQRKTSLYSAFSMNARRVRINCRPQLGH
jgi:hypothetical protein